MSDELRKAIEVIKGWNWSCSSQMGTVLAAAERELARGVPGDAVIDPKRAIDPDPIREAFEKANQRRGPRRKVEEEDFIDGWNAALEKAAERLEEIAKDRNFPDEAEIYKEAADAVRALKGDGK